MSKTVDERVVSMEFDNSKFEKNVHTTMSTLDKLKQSLNFKGASKAFENIDSSAKKVDMSHLGNAVESVKMKFSALDVMAVTVLTNITNSAFNAGKKIISALTIDPVRTGFQEYETQINAVQTILANTQSKGTNIEQVNKALDELNEYADLTIYNFTEMTRNIGTFTAAGVDLDTSVNAIKGIANLAAVSGSTSQQASTAMYQLSQALASGTVKLMDWNSVVNAGMGGQVFQDALKETARVHGIAIDSMIDKQGSFRETLSEGWLTSEILTETLQKFTLTTEGLTEEQIKANREMLKAKGYTEEQIDEIFKLGNTATDAATKVKTFTQLWDVLKEAAQSGWAQTWRLIFGDFEEAKSLFTPLSEFFTGIISKISDARNLMLDNALSRGFKDLSDKISGMLDPAKDAIDTVTETIDAVTDLGDIVEEVILGKFGNGTDRYNALTEAGINYYRVQNKVNETLNDGFRYSEEQIAAQDKLLGIQNGVTEGLEEESEVTQELTEDKKELIKQLAKMSEAEMRAAGYSEPLIEALNELRATSEKLGLSTDEFVDNMDEINGRWLLLNGFKNIGKSLIQIFNSMKEAWSSIFPPKSIEEKGEAVFNLLAAFNKFTSGLIMTDESADNLSRTFKGLFALLDLVTTFVGGGFKLAFKAVSIVLSYFDLNILDVTATIGDALVKFRDWVKENNFLVKGLKELVPYIKDATEAIKEWFDGIKEADNVPKYIIQGLCNGLKAGIGAVIGTVIELAKGMIDAICKVLGIHSPSKEFEEIGKFSIEGLLNGLKSGVSAIWEFVKMLGTKFVEFVGNIDWGAVLAVAITGGIFYLAKQFLSITKMLAAPLEGLGDLFSGVGEMFEGLGKNLKAKALKNKSKAILNFAIAIGILAASIYVLAQLDTGKLWATIGAIGALAAIMVALAFVANKIGEVNALGGGKPSVAILGMATSLLVIALAMRQLAKINIEDVPKVLILLGTAILGLASLMLAFKVIGDTKGLGSADKVGKMLFKAAAALLILAFVMKIVGKLEKDEIAKGLIVIGALEILFGAMIAVSAIAGEYGDKAGKMLLKMSLAMLIMVGVIKIAGHLKPEEIVQGIFVISLVSTLFLAFIAVSKLAGQNATKAGGMLLMMSAAMLVMVMVVKSAAKLDEDDLVKGLTVVGMIGVLFTALIAVSKLAGKNAGKAGKMLLMMSASMLILTGIIFLISKMDPEGVERALGVITVLETLFIGLVAVTSIVKDCRKDLITMIVAIGLLTAMVVGLTFLDPRKLTIATGCLTMVIGALTLLMGVTKITKDVKLGSMAILLGVVAGLASIIAALSLLNVDGAMSATASISILLTTMSASLFIISGIGPNAMKAVGAMALLGLVVAEIGVILGLLQHFNINPSIETATALSILLLALSGSCVILSTIGAAAPAAVSGAAALSGVAIILAALVGTLGYIAGIIPEDVHNEIKEGIGRIIDICQEISYGFGAIISSFVEGLFDGLPGIADTLCIFMNNMQPFFDSLNSIDSATIDNGKKLSQMLLTLTAADLLEQLTGWLFGESDAENFGKSIVQFGKSLVEFSNIEGIDGIKTETMKKVAEAGNAMAEMADSVPKTDGILQDLVGASDIEDFGNKIKAFCNAMIQTSELEGLSSIDVSSIKKASEAGIAMTDLADKVPKTDGILQDLVGASDIEDFGNKIKAFCDAMIQTSELEGLLSIDVSAFENASTAGIAMTDLADKVPKTDGFWQKIAGEKDIASFGEKIKTFSKSIITISKLKGIDNINIDSIKNIAAGGMALSLLAKSIPEDLVFGINEYGLGEFGPAMSELISGFVEIFNALPEGYTNTDANKLHEFILASSEIMKLAKYMEPISAIALIDSESVEKFGTNICSIGSAIKAFALISSTDIDLEAIDNMLACSKKVFGMVKAMPPIDEIPDMDELGTQVVKFAKHMRAFGSSLSGIDTEKISSDVKSFKELVGAFKDLGAEASEAFSQEFSTGSFDAEKTISKSLRDVVNSISNKKTDFSNAGKLLVSNLVTGIDSKKSDVKTTFTLAVAGAISGINNEDSYNGFYNAGDYLIDGFIDGMEDSLFKVKLAATSIALAAKKAAEDALGIQSPSKVFYGIGSFTGQGFVNALHDYSDKAYTASFEMADYAKDGFNTAINGILTMLDTDLDMQPTIRPVLDLSDVESGAGTIGSMFGNGISLGTTVKNIRSINSMMNNKIQNGANDDVVSAINKLEKSISNTGNTTYNVNGITYDDGSNISDAVRALIRAARVERRV